MLSSCHNFSTHFYRSRYEYTHQEDRMWRKNRAKTPSSLLNILGSCKGVDLNRFNSFPVVFLNFGSFPHSGILDTSGAKASTYLTLQVSCNKSYPPGTEVDMISLASQFSIGHCSYNENFVNCTHQCLWNGSKRA